MFDIDSEADSIRGETVRIPHLRKSDNITDATVLH